MDDTELMHYGIRGMKWGIRRYQNKDGTLTAAGKQRDRAQNRKQARKEINKSRKSASKNRSLMSDAELDRRIKRLEKEKKLRELTESEVSPGKSYAKKAMDRYGSQVAAAFVGAGAGMAIKAGKSYLDKRGLGFVQPKLPGF